MTTPEATIVAALIIAIVPTGGWLLTWYISRTQRKADFRMAALDRRLAIHQEAYKLWWEMVSALHSKTGPDKAAECQKWWIGNCLYLDAKSRKEFIDCAGEAFFYNDLKDINKPAETKARFQRIMRVFELLAEGVELPTIGENEGRSKEIKQG